MDHPIISLFIFVIVVLFYFHLVAQWKKSEDLEIYETDYLNDTQLQEVCAIKQPVLFLFRQPTALYNMVQFSAIEKYITYNVRVKDVFDYRIPTTETIETIELPLRSVRRLFSADVHSRYISENNESFLEETGLDRAFSPMDAFLKPSGCLYTRYDMWFGSKRATTPMRYHTNAEYFIVPTSGKITVKMTPWKSRAYLHPVKDFESYEFWSRVNVWAPDSTHTADMEKLRLLEFDVLPGHILSIPPYWWYSIRFSTDTDTCVCAFMYDTVINAVAHSYDWGMYYLQQSNIHTRVTMKPSSRISEVNSIGGNVDTLSQPIRFTESSETTVPIAPVEDASIDVVTPINIEKREIVTNMGSYHT